MTRIATSLLALLMLFITACTSTPDLESEPTAQTPPAGLAPWTARGKMIVVQDGRAESLSFRWTRQTADDEQIQLSGLFGLGAVVIERSGDTLSWNDDGKSRPLRDLGLTDDAQTLIAELPYASLGEWLIGASSPPSGPWQLSVEEWQVLSSRRIPRRLRLDRDGTGLRVAINDWSTQ